MSPNPSIVNIRLDKSGQALTLNWTGTAHAPIDNADIARFHDLANRVGEAEKSPTDVGHAIPRGRLKMGRAPTTCGRPRTPQRLEQSRATGSPCDLIVRLQTMIRIACAALGCPLALNYWLMIRGVWRRERMSRSRCNWSEQDAVAPRSWPPFVAGFVHGVLP